MTINPKNEEIVRIGMVFNIRVGLQDLKIKANSEEEENT